MKKLLLVVAGKSTRIALLAIVALGTGLAFWKAGAAPSATPGGGHQPCVVCHNVQRNPHTITIDCNALEKHLAHGDYEGPCRTPTPTPSPSPTATPTPSPTPTPPPGKDKCEVCHNPHNYHTIRIPCDKVDKFLENHPGDYRGPCDVTTVTNP